MFTKQNMLVYVEQLAYNIRGMESLYDFINALETGNKMRVMTEGKNCF